jgi:transmembrane sensor
MALDNDSSRVPISASVIDRYLAGIATADECALVERWWRTASPDDHVRHLMGAQVSDAQSIARVWDRIQADALDDAPVMVFTTAPVSGASSAIHVARDARQRGGLSGRSVTPRKTVFGGIGTYVVAFAAVAMLALLGVTVLHVVPRASALVTERTYATRAGQQADVTLADGSRVTLAPATTLHTTISAETHAVTVTVDGEALFHVQHRPQVPFTVRTRNAATRVLGTEFLVRQYVTDRTARVVVADGRISLRSVGRSGATEIVMAARTLGTVDDSGHVQVTPNIAADEYTAWTRGQLIFQKTPVRDAVVDLGRAYGVEIRVQDSTLARYTLTWSVPVQQLTLAGALDALAAVLSAHVVRSGDVITLVPGRATSVQPRYPDSLSIREKGYGR